MKIENKEEAENLNTWTATRNPFSKVNDMKLPDSPPPEEESEEEDKPGQPNKFERLMKAACSIKTAELDLRKKKFELLPGFLKAGVYYTTKLNAIRQTKQFYPRFFAYELLIANAKKDYLSGNAGGACRKYEEAYSIWRYFYSSNPKWDKEGIDDFYLREVDW
jgi:hypothetical protein